MIVAGALSLAVLAAVPVTFADGAPSGDGSNSAIAGNAAVSSGQVLEIPPTDAPKAAVPSADSDSAAEPSIDDTSPAGPNGWTDKHVSDDELKTPQESLPNPSYAGVDEYMSQDAQAEAMNPAYSPLFGVPLPLLVNPFMLYGTYPLQRSGGFARAPRTRPPGSVTHGGGVRSRGGGFPRHFRPR